mmetsp:Transcript_34940/g.62429  ORF Transcript_34940/g.62429 Transcript_34940/m.62429 type:complete len:311 (-) Transcript_34940:802-1734(-)
MATGDRVRPGSLELGPRAQDASLADEVEQGPQLIQVVLERCPAEEDTVLGLDLPDVLRHLDGGVLDSVSLVQDNVVPGDRRLFEELDSGPKEAIVHEADTAGPVQLLQDPLALIRARLGAQPVDGQRRRPLCEFFHPVLQHGLRYQDKSMFNAPRMQHAFQERDDLDGLAQPHIVPEQAPRPHAVALPKPLHTVALVIVEPVEHVSLKNEWPVAVRFGHVQRVPAIYEMPIPYLHGGAPCAARPAQLGRHVIEERAVGALPLRDPLRLFEYWKGGGARSVARPALLGCLVVAQCAGGAHPLRDRLPLFPP